MFILPVQRSFSITSMLPVSFRFHVHPKHIPQLPKIDHVRALAAPEARNPNNGLIIVIDRSLQVQRASHKLGREYSTLALMPNEGSRVSFRVASVTMEVVFEGHEGICGRASSQFGTTANEINNGI